RWSQVACRSAIFSSPCRSAIAAAPTLAASTASAMSAWKRRRESRRRAMRISVASGLEEGPDAPDELAAPERLDDVVVGAGRAAALQVRHLRAGGDHDDPGCRGGRVLAQLPADLDAGHAREHPVQEHQVRLHPARRIEAAL